MRKKSTQKRDATRQSQPSALAEQLAAAGFKGSEGSPKPERPQKKKRGGQKKKQLSETNAIKAQKRGKKKRKRARIGTPPKRKGTQPPLKSLFPGEEATANQPSPISEPHPFKIAEDEIRQMLDNVSLSVRHTATTCEVSAEDRSDIHARHLACSGYGGNESESDDETLLYLGFDFGSTSTKLVFSTPYDTRYPRFAVPAPKSLRLEDNPYLWASSIWETPDGAFSLLPAEESKRHDRFKVDLMRAFDGEEHSPAHPSVPDSLIATSAYFALMMSQALGWHRINHPQIWQAAPVEYFVNFGFPASSLDKPQTHAAYVKCAAAALELLEASVGLNGQLAVTRQSIEAALCEVGDRTFEDEEWGVIPEITAAVAGFANSVERRDSLYMILDVGGVTVDASIFKLTSRNSGRDRCPIFSAAVRRLGVEVFRQWEETGHDSDEFSGVVTNQIAGVVQHAFKRLRSESVWGEELTVFFTGGGTSSSVHQKALDAASERTRRKNWCNTDLDIRSLPNENTEAPGLKPDDHHRLLVAIGLARSIDDIPQWTTQSNIADPPPRRSNYSENFVGAEQV